MSPDRNMRPCDVSQVRQLVLAGWAGRDVAAVEAHIRELAAHGVPRPSSTPVFYRAAASLLTTAERVEVVGTETSGEVEFVLVMTDDGLWIGVGSDHTDRELERTSVARSKQVCAKVVARELWAFNDVEPHWDSLVLRSWVVRDGARTRYQESRVDAVLAPGDLVAAFRGAGGELRSGTAMFGGTIATIGGVMPSPVFEMELEDPVLRRVLHHRYEVTALPVVS